MAGARRLAVAAALVAAVWLAAHVAEVDFGRLVAGLPRLAHWAATAWPPDLSEFGLVLRNAGVTLAIATAGTAFAALLAMPLALAASATFHVPWPLRAAARGFLNALRGIDGFVFALIFVAAVGLGAFAGVIGVMLHSAGSIAKLWAEAIEAQATGPLEAVGMTGAGRLKLAVHVVLPDLLPALGSALLYVWEFNVRASTVLGVVGAGGIGQDLKNSVDLLAFDRTLTILVVILVMVAAIDRLSAEFRRRLA
jgi:phosphonate transport system permease protein